MKEGFFISILAKVLLFPSYRSTDASRCLLSKSSSLIFGEQFDVHRNWLRITHTRPLSEWYTDDLSIWTLDYPPFFAYFEWLLATVASWVDKDILDIGRDTESAVIYQRTTVILSEFVLAWAVYKYAQYLKVDNTSKQILFYAILFHPGFFLLDHIHFQYNGMLFGILILAVTALRRQQFAQCTLLFAALLNFKHIFIYLALPFLVYLMRTHCLIQDQFRMDRFLQLGLLGGSVCAVSFGPFLLADGLDGIRNILSQLFPFQRGLNHAYWAPNFWALYSAADRVLIYFYKAQGYPIPSEALQSGSRGLVGNTVFGVLPDISPRICLLIVLSLNSLILVRLWFRPLFQDFLQSLTLSAYVSFLFGWHVHEKACMLFLVPLLLLVTEDGRHFQTLLLSSAAGIYSLLPLMIHPHETPFKVFMPLLWFLSVMPALANTTARSHQRTPFSKMIRKLEVAYLLGFIPLFSLTEFVIPRVLHKEHGLDIRYIIDWLLRTAPICLNKAPSSMDPALEDKAGRAKK